MEKAVMVLECSLEQRSAQWGRAVVGQEALGDQTAAVQYLQGGYQKASSQQHVSGQWLTILSWLMRGRRDINKRFFTGRMVKEWSKVPGQAVPSQRFPNPRNPLGSQCLPCFYKMAGLQTPNVPSNWVCVFQVLSHSFGWHDQFLTVREMDSFSRLQHQNTFF